jgi:CRISPR system Cascade subunit CasE
MMANDPPNLYMLRLVLDAARVAREAVYQRLSLRHEDLGYLLHSYLSNLFGSATVQPFRELRGRTKWLPVVGYTKSGREDLIRYAADFADPARYAACDWDSFAVKPLPTDWRTGRSLSFELRACPVVRLSSEKEIPGRGGESLRYRAGAEIDAWEHTRFFGKDKEPEINREKAYSIWLRKRLGEGASLESMTLRSFRRLRLSRRDHGSPRKARILERPEAILHGRITIGDPGEFQNLLATGVGRHRAFGFGMLLLRP